MQQSQLTLNYTSVKRAQEAWLNRVLVAASAISQGFQSVKIQLHSIHFAEFYPHTILSSMTTEDFKLVTERLANSSVVTCVTSMQSHTCLLINDVAEPGRLTMPVAQYIGRNWLWSWRDSMEDLEFLVRELKQNGHVENFEHRLRRSDGSLCKYRGDAEVVNFFGIPCRILYNHEWQIVEPALFSSQVKQKP